MRLLLLVPDGVGIRNFVLGRFLDLATARGTVDVLHALPATLRAALARDDDPRIRWHPLRDYSDGPVRFVLRNALVYAQIRRADTRALRYRDAAPLQGSWQGRAARRIARAIGRGAAATGTMAPLDRCYHGAMRGDASVAWYRELLTRIRPDVVFCSHQRPLGVLPPVLAAQSLGIPTATFIFSWDNLTTSAHIAAPFDHFLVWSDHMRGELLRYYPHVAHERTHVVGTPQFDVYADETLLWSRAEFARRIGADAARPIICYSGGDALTCPEDPLHVAVLLDLVRRGAIGGDPQVVLRPSPVDDGRRYAAVRERYPELLYAAPAWVHAAAGDWSRVFPSAADVQLLANLTRHADVNVNLASTMTMDFAIRDKPVVNVAFDVADPPPFGKPLWEHYYQFEHYRPVVEIGAARFAHSPAELAAHVDGYLRDPTLDRENRRRLLELQVGWPIGDASRRVLDVLTTIAG